MHITSLLPERARSVLAQGDDDRIDEAFDVTDLLMQLVDARVALTLATPDGLSCTTELVGIDAQAGRITFAASARDLRLRQLVDADEAMAVAYLERVRLQFDLSGLVMVHGAKDSVLQAEWPAAIYRFQRRESYRVRPLDHHKPVAHLRHPLAPHESLCLRVIDVSLGGLALQMGPDAALIQPGSRLAPVAVELDALTCLDAALRVVHVSVLNTGSNVMPSTRLGCEWISLAGEGTRALQRYIEQTQKRQRQRLLVPATQA